MLRKQKTDLIRALYVYKAPIVLHPPEEHTPLPESLKKAIVASRLEAVANGDFDRGLASVADLVAYLYSASLKFPLSEKYVTIYAYYANKLFKNRLEGVVEVPDELPPYYEEIANDLRRKIFKVQMRELKKLVEQAVPNNEGGEGDD